MVQSEIGSSNFPVGNVSCIAVGASEDTLVATFSNYGIPSVWVTANGGQSWTDVEANLPDMPIRWALIHPDYSRNVMLATETGVWITEDILTTPVFWEPVTDGMANVRTDMLRLRNVDHTVLAASHGRGLFTTTWDPVVGMDEQSKTAMNLYPNPATNQVNISFDLITPAILKVKLINTTGQTVLTENLQTEGKFSTRVDLTGQAKGIYILVLEEKGKVVASEKLILL